MTWDPVPGASSYGVQVVPADYETTTELVAGCNWTALNVEEMGLHDRCHELHGARAVSIDTPSGISYPNHLARPEPRSGLRDGDVLRPRRGRRRPRRQQRCRRQRLDPAQWRTASADSPGELRRSLDRRGRDAGGRLLAPQAGSVHRLLPLFTWRPGHRAPRATTSWSPRTPCSPTSRRRPHLPAGLRAPDRKEIRGPIRTRRRPTTGPSTPRNR